MHDEKAIVSKTACPRCSCHMVSHFECGCGAAHGNYCLNCGRWVDLPPDEHVELAPFDARCEAGAVEHEHTDEEKSARLNEWVRAA